MKVFFDTGVFLALFISSEEYHAQVTKKYREYRKVRALFFTSCYILDELYTRLVYDFGKYETLKIIKLLGNSIDKEEISLLEIDEIIFKKALETLIKFSEHNVSFTDATTYILYRDFNLDEVFTLDSDFKKIGVKTSF